MHSMQHPPSLVLTYRASPPQKGQANKSLERTGDVVFGVVIALGAPVAQFGRSAARLASTSPSPSAGLARRSRVLGIPSTRPASATGSSFAPRPRSPAGRFARALCAGSLAACTAAEQGAGANRRGRLSCCSYVFLRRSLSLAVRRHSVFAARNPIANPPIKTHILVTISASSSFIFKSRLLAEFFPPDRRASFDPFFSTPFAPGV